jgi:GH24 family phage-related lysozyme (muramidase)
MITILQNDLAFVAAREACVLSVYPDSQNPAFGFGQNDPSLKIGDTGTLEHAIDLFKKKAKEIADALDHIFADVHLEQQHIGACWSLMYNIGRGGFTDQHDLIAAIKSYRADPKNRKKRDAVGFGFICATARGWNFAEKGPFNFSRRAREALLFVTGDYGDLSTMELWPAGKSPRNNPPDPPTVVPMPQFI